MNKTANLYIRINPQIKEEAENMFSNFGMTITEAVNIFLHKSLMVGGLPFDVVQPRYNAETEAAIEEGRLIAKDKNAETYNDIVSLRRAIER
jgi:DNA-damage-inducible protein J